jgi:ubiquinone/menaquinone biosynthesis C-methylase UbiE
MPTGRFDCILDIGGGTGNVRPLWPAASRYICLDLDQPKLKAFRRKVTDGIPVMADGRCIPIASESVDALMCTKVAHHLSENAIEEVVREGRRILKPRGYFVFMDPVKRPDRLASRLMWNLDRGAFPYLAEQLIDILRRHFEIVETKRFSTWHDFLIVVLRKP